MEILLHNESVQNMPQLWPKNDEKLPHNKLSLAQSVAYVPCFDS